TFIILSTIRPQPTHTTFPYTTLFRSQAAGAEHDEAHARQPAAVREQFAALEPGRQGAVPRVALERRDGRHDPGRQVRGGLRSVRDRPGSAARHAIEIGYSRHAFHEA